MKSKVVVLAAGLGTRMRREGQNRLSGEQAEVARSGLKAMIPIGRPFLDYVLTNVADAGYGRVCLVVGPDHDVLRDHYGSLSGGRLDFEFAVQEDRLGTAHALATAADFAGDDPFLLINSDNLYPTSALRDLARAEGYGCAGFHRDGLVRRGNISPDQVAQFCIVEQGSGGELKRLIEKPDPALVAELPDPVLVSMNCWRLGPEIFAACGAIKKSARGEFELPDAVDYSIRELGIRYQVVESTDPVLDLSGQDDISRVTELLAGVEAHL